MRAFLIAALLCGPAQAADLAVLASNAVKEAYVELAPQFEKAGHRLATTWDGTGGIVKRMQSREPFDVVIVASDSLEMLTDSGRIIAGSRVDLVRSGVGVAVRAGAPKPDITSSEAVKRALLAAKTVGISMGPSGVYLRSMFEKMGIASELEARLRVAPSGTPVGDLLAKGEAEIGFQQVSELLHAKGIQFLGPLPADIQRMTIFSGGVPVASQEPDAARAFLRFLSRPENTEVLKKHGLESGAAQY